MSSEDVLNKIAGRVANVGVIGLGYVGLPLALEFVSKGFRVFGFDVDENKIAKIAAGETYIQHIDAARITDAVRRGFTATRNFDLLKDVDAIIICVPTPLTRHREPDLTFVTSTARSIAKSLRRDHLVILESTTYPGTTRDVVKPILEETGLVAGKDFFLAFSPEREDPSNPTFTTATIPKVVGGLTEGCGRIAAKLYSSIVSEVVPVASCEIAEAAKILENTFRSVNIALVNELKMVFARMGIDIWQVIDAAATKPFGFMKFTPGPGLGGHCVPIDPFYLTWKAHEYELPVRFIEMAGEVNTQMPNWVCQRILEELSIRGVPMKGARILNVGLAYKKNVDDDRESPSYKLMSILTGYGATVDYHDPFIPAIRLTRAHPEFAGKRSVPLSNLGSYDAIVIATNHDAIDWEGIRRQSKLIFDTRGVYQSGTPNVVKV